MRRGESGCRSDPTTSLEGNRIMKRLILTLALAASALGGCAQLREPSAESGATGAQQTRPYPQSSSNLGLF
jgi:hypothetical protein